MTPEIIASMTSYPARIATVHLAVESLLRQTFKADRIILWLADTQFPKRLDELPAPLLEQTGRGLEIRWCDDLRSYKRQYYAFREFPSAAIVIVDDDLIYPSDMLETLVNSWKRFPNAVSAMRVHMIRFDAAGELTPYNSWKYEYSGLIGAPSMSLYATPGGGTLVPPGCMHEATFDLENITQICPTADDIWMKIMYTLTDTPVVLAAENRPLLEIPETQEQALWRDNCVRNESDRQRSALLEKYNKLYGNNDTLVSRMRRDADSYTQRERPALSVIIAPNGDAAAAQAALDSALRQTMADIEIIVGRGEPCADSRVRSVETDGGLTHGLSVATLASQGDYVLYLMPGDQLADGACAALMARLGELETDPNRLRVDILDANAAKAGRVGSDAIVAAMLGQRPDCCLSGKLLRGALCRLAFRHIDAERCAAAHPAAAGFIMAVCAKGYYNAPMSALAKRGGTDYDVHSRAAAIGCIAEFLGRIGGEEAFGGELGVLCAALTECMTAPASVALAQAIGVLTQANRAARARRDDLRAQLAEAVDRGKGYKAAAEQAGDRSAESARIRELQGQIQDIYGSTIYKVGRVVTMIPRKCKLLFERLLRRD